MATEYLFSNNATTTLAQSVSATATVLNVASGDGIKFPSPSSGQAFAVTLADAATGLTNEICYCTSRSGDQLTVVRGREGTNAIAWSAGDTCANYITADVMESWLQESDLNGYATQSWVAGSYIRSPANPATDARILTISRNKSGGGIFAQADDGSNTQLQPAGDYATNSALTAETTRATTVESNLQSSKVNRSGDTMTGQLAVEGPTTGINVGSNANNGSGTNDASITFNLNKRFGYAGVVGLRENVGSSLAMMLSAYNGSSWYEFDFVAQGANQGRFTSPAGVSALISDLSNYVPISTYTNDISSLQNNINAKLDSSFVASGLFDGSQGSTTSGTIVGGTWTRVGNTMTQNLVIKNIGGGTVTFPFAFSGNNNQVTVIVQDGTGSNNTYTTGSVTTTGTGIHASGGGGTGRLHLTASGPYGT